MMVGAGPTGVVGVRDYLDRPRPQLWAEAVHQYRAGVEARLPRDLELVQVDVNERHRHRDDVLEDALAHWLPTAPAQFTLTEAAVGCGLVVEPHRATSLPVREQRRLGKGLTAAGYGKRRTRVEGKLAMLWSRELCSPCTDVHHIS